LQQPRRHPPRRPRIGHHRHRLGVVPHHRPPHHLSPVPLESHLLPHPKPHHLPLCPPLLHQPQPRHHHPVQLNQLLLRQPLQHRQHPRQVLAFRPLIHPPILPTRPPPVDPAGPKVTHGPQGGAGAPPASARSPYARGR